MNLVSLQNPKEARALSAFCDNPCVISAVAQRNGSIVQISNKVTSVFGSSENQLIENQETVFSMIYDDEKG